MAARQFQRNGARYAPERATSHLNQKYEYLLKKGLVTRADWLRAELQRFRTKKPE